MIGLDRMEQAKQLALDYETNTWKWNVMRRKQLIRELPTIIIVQLELNIFFSPRQLL
jgi:hypothetical protein